MGQGVSTSTGGPGTGTSDSCCLEQAALDCVSIPVVVSDADRLLFANTRARRLLGLDDAHPNIPIEGIVVPPAAPGAAERRRVQLETGVELGPLQVKAQVPGLGAVEVVSRGARICYGADEHRALAHVICRVGSTTFCEPNESYSEGRAAKCAPGACVHAAAFEALPIPLTVLSHDAIVRSNRAFRGVIKVDEPIDGSPLTEIVHPDFAEAGRLRRHLVLDLGAPVENSSVKLRAHDGSALYLIVDAMRAVFDGAPYMVALARRATSI